MAKRTPGRRLLVSAAVVVVLAAGGAVAAFAGRAGSGQPSAAPSSTPSTTTSSGGAMAGMAGMAGMPKAMPITPLASATWQGMKIEARAAAPVEFVLMNGSSEQVVHPTKRDSMHLMVMLSDAQTGMAIPYASVWATIRTTSGKIVYDERQWPMLSRFMGTHYGNNVALPGKGTYRLTLLISPPEAARHMEYAHVWLKPHRVNVTFHWNGGV
jgi:uncharacterized protein involved in high-affinity Fe2+ transport